ncbi:hypothetical protein ACQ4M3_20420 [Leptolyngbya sp. AN03gr2]|uniref:hypothetical protein n=1 Tax=unclassified Leptolyngbya TaxID=2650499 RepID=UPI003D31E6D5
MPKTSVPSQNFTVRETALKPRRFGSKAAISVELGLSEVQIRHISKTLADLH